jgi:3-hydroxymyristoyl/3-hydroxydecanoyl-(acyl carrier protein) dehydratase
MLQMLIIEAMAQICALLCCRSDITPKDGIDSFTSIDICRFWCGVALHAPL